MLRIERQREHGERLSPEQILAFLKATDKVQFEEPKPGRYLLRNQANTCQGSDS